MLRWDQQQHRDETQSANIRRTVAIGCLLLAAMIAYCGLPKGQDKISAAQFALELLLFHPFFLASLGAGIGALFDRLWLGLLIGFLVPGIFWILFARNLPVAL
jgi:hypothetical protein